MENRNTRKVLERTVNKVVIIPYAANAGIGIEARNNRIPVSGLSFGYEKGEQ